MANDGLKHVVHRRVHLERSQPEHRKRKVGQYLEKKADYKKRSERYHVREKLIKELSAKTRFRNEDEFNFKMIHGKIGSEGQVILESEDKRRKRKLTKREKVKNDINLIDTNMFVVNHKQNVINKKLERMIPANISIISSSIKPAVTKRANGSRSSGKAGGGTHILYEDSDTDPDTSRQDDATNIRGFTASSRKNNSATTSNPGNDAASAEEFLKMSDMFNNKKELDNIRAKLEDRRNLTVAKYKKKQVRKVRNSRTKIHEYPTERLK